MKKIASLLILTLALFLPVSGALAVVWINSIRFNVAGGGAAYVDEVLADSPTWYSRLAETSGTAADDIGSANTDGTYLGGYTLAVTSLLTSDTANKAVDLDGSSGRISIPNSASNFSGVITVECLVKFDSFPSSGNSMWLVGKGYSSPHDATGYALYVYNDSGTRKIYFVSYNGSSHGTNYNVDAWTTGTTYHVVGTYTGSAWKLYVNGSEVASTTDGTGAVSSNTRNTHIGVEENTFGTSNFLDGVIDEVALYSTSLSAARVAAHHAAR